MNRLVTITVIAVVVVGAAGLTLYFQPATEETSTYHVCRVCGSYRVTRKTTGDGVEIQASVETRRSNVFTDLLGERHEHDWAFDYSNSKSSTGFTRAFTHGDGFPHRTGPMPNRFTSNYNENTGFKAFVNARIRAGDLSRDLAGRIVLLDDDDLDGASPAASKARSLHSEFFGR